MLKNEAIQKMVSPRDKRQGIWREGVLQIRITGACDKACFGCTQGSNLRHKANHISLEHFEQACSSLRGYFGVIGIFGGNPTLHPQFEGICEILRSHFKQEQCGLWCNKLFGKGGIARQTFNPNYSNLNVHLDKDAVDEFRRDWPEATRILGENSDSRHSPPFVAMQDVIPDESERWELISSCDVNREWSAMIATFRGELRAWFCELAGSQSILHENDEDYPDTGMPVAPGWWQKPIEDFECQISYHCHACGIPLRGHGDLAVYGKQEQVSKTHIECFKPKDNARLVQLITDRSELQEQSLKRATNYIGNAKE